LRVIRFRLSPYRQSLRVSRAASPLSSAVRFNLTVTRSTLLRLRRPPTFAGAFHQYQQAADHFPGHPIPKTNSSNYRWLFSPHSFAQLEQLPRGGDERPEHDVDCSAASVIAIALHIQTQRGAFSARAGEAANDPRSIFKQNAYALALTH